MTLGICAVRSGSERQAQRDIERAGYGTRIPSFRVTFNRNGIDHVRVRALFPGMVFTYLDQGDGDLDAIEGIRLLRNGERLLLIRGKDEEELNRLERHCLLGDFNKVSRNKAGQFSGSKPALVTKPKQKKRRQRSLNAKAERRKRRRAKRRVRNHTDNTNQLAA